MHSYFLKSVLTLAGGTGLGQLLLVLASPLITRLYTPKDFGIFAIFAALLGILSVISSMRYELAIPLPKRNSQAFQILILSLIINLVFGLIILLLILSFKKELSTLINITVYTNLLYLLPLGIVSTGIYKAFNYWAIRKKAYRLIGQTKIAQGFANVTIQILIGFLSFGAYGLAFAQIIGQSVGVCSLFRVFWKDKPNLNCALKVKRLKTQSKRFYRFPVYDTPAALMNAVSEQLPQFLLAMLFSPMIAGFYLLAHRILMAPLSLIGQSVGQVVYGFCSEKLERGELGKFALKIALSLCSMMLVPALLLWFNADDIFSFIFSEDWREAGIFAAWMILGIAVQFAYSPLSLIFLATNGQNVNLILHTSIMLLRTIAIIVGWQHDDVMQSIIGYSVTGFIGYGVGIVLLVKRAYRYDKNNLTRKIVNESFSV